MYICICQHDEWDFSFDLVYEINLTDYITKNCGCYVQPFDEGKIGISHELQCEAFFTSFSPPDPGDVPSHGWYFLDIVRVFRGSDIEEIGGERLIWVKVSGKWCGYSYEDYEDFTENHNDGSSTLFDYYNIQQTTQ